MAKATPVAYNTGSTISNTLQIGSLAIATGNTALNNAVRWWNGPDEDLGYVVAVPVSGGTQPTPDGVNAYIGFYRSKLLTDASFISLSEFLSNRTQTFASGSAAKTWLNNNGYWTSYTGSTNDVTPNPVDWPDVYSIYPAFPTTINQTISGINVVINLFWSCSYCGDGGSNNIQISINDGAWTNISENTNFSVNNNDTLKFRLTDNLVVGGFIRLDVKNNSDGNSLLDTFILSWEPG